MAYKRSRQAFEADLQKVESPYVFYGTPLPPLDEHVRDDGSFVPVWKQEVTDDRGRKRLHGAFTGGFSAGYYNTVGSKEGWAPSTFVSSRKNRAKDANASNQQRPEDYMDEEDLREAEDARQLQTADAFSGFGTQHDERHKGSIMDIFHSTEDTAGVKLLKRMGWKEGQGIGPKVRRRANLHDDGHQSDELHSFAPDDVPMISFTQKHDRKGLGYDGEDAPQNGASKPFTSSGRNVAARLSDEDDDESNGPVLGPRTVKGPRKRGAFGYGVLNDTGSDDDDDPYSMGPKISYSKTLGGDKKPKKKPLVPNSTANPSLKTKPVLLSKKLAGIQSALRKCHDGRLPIDGFVLGNDLDGMASLSLKSDKYKPPAVPSDWTSSFTPTTEHTTSTTPFASTSAAANTSTLTSTSRANILGEALLPGKSVFDFLTPSARDRLAAASGKSNLPPGLGEKPTSTTSSTPTNSDLASLVPQLPQATAELALSRAHSGWMPYSDEPAKQTRYKTYLEIRAGLHPTDSNGDTLPPRAPGMNQDDWLIELHEFARAAEVFRPVTGIMASRFTSSTSTPPQSSATTNPPAADGQAGADTLLSKPKPKSLSPAEEAARMGMFGHMTRSQVNFYPTRLLCKRFGVDMPVHSTNEDTRSSTNAGVSASMHPAPNQPPSFNPGNRFQAAGSYQSSQETQPTAPTPDTTTSGAHGQLPHPHQMDSEPNTTTTTTPAAPSISISTSTMNLDTSSSTIDTSRNEALEQPKPGRAIFKAIFGSDDEDEDEDSD